jgi:hypothetical protein
LTLVYVLYTFTHKNFVMCRDDAMRDTDETGTITLAFRAPRALAAAAERAAAKEGLSRSAVARRALLRGDPRLRSSRQIRTRTRTQSDRHDQSVAFHCCLERGSKAGAKLRRIGPAKETAC